MVHQKYHTDIGAERNEARKEVPSPGTGGAKEAQWVDSTRERERSQIERLARRI